MIKKIKIENFQSHENTEITFTEGINVIVGPTNSGKSSIMRALRKVIRNDPMGDFFVRWGKNQARIVINDIVERVITTSKSGVNNNIILHGEERKEFKNGRGLPPIEILQALDISEPLSIDGINEDFNCIKQKQPSFLIDSYAYPPSRVAKFFDYLSGAGILNLCVFETKARIGNLNTLNKKLFAEQEELQIKMKKYIYVSILKNLKEVLSRLNNLKNRRDTFNVIRDQINTLNRQRREIESISKKIKAVQLMRRRLRKLQMIEALKNLDIQLGTCVEIDLHDFIYRVKKYKSILNYHALTAQEPDKNLLNIYTKNFYTRIIVLRNILQLKIFKEESNTLNMRIKQLENEHMGVLKANKICPTCKRSL